MACFCVSSRSVAFYFKDDRQLQIEFVLVDWNLYGKCKATSYSNIGERSELANGLTHEIINESPKHEAFMAKVAEYVPFFSSVQISFRTCSYIIYMIFPHRHEQRVANSYHQMVTHLNDHENKIGMHAEKLATVAPLM